MLQSSFSLDPHATPLASVSEVRKWDDWWWREPLLDLIKSLRLLALFSLWMGVMMLENVSDWSIHEDESWILRSTSNSQWGFTISFLTWRLHFSDSTNISRISPKSFASHYASKEFPLCHEEDACVWIQIQSTFVKDGEKLFQCEHILLKYLGVDQVVGCRSLCSHKMRQWPGLIMQWEKICSADVRPKVRYV